MINPDSRTLVLYRITPQHCISFYRVTLQVPVARVYLYLNVATSTRNLSQLGQVTAVPVGLQYCGVLVSFPTITDPVLVKILPPFCVDAQSLNFPTPENDINHILS